MDIRVYMCVCVYIYIKLIYFALHLSHTVNQPSSKNIFKIKIKKNRRSRAHPTKANHKRESTSNMYQSKMGIKNSKFWVMDGPNQVRSLLPLTSPLCSCQPQRGQKLQRVSRVEGRERRHKAGRERGWLSPFPKTAGF